MRMICVCVFLAAAWPAWSQPSGSPSFAVEGVVAAPLAAVWEVWSTPEGYKRLGVAQVEMDFRVGGLIRSRYAAGGRLGDEQTIDNRIMAFEPQRMLAIRIDRPPASFPFKDAWRQTWTVITMNEVDRAQTHVRIASLGYGQDAESVAMRRFFEDGNAATLRALQQTFARPAAGAR